MAVVVMGIVAGSVSCCGWSARSAPSSARSLSPSFRLRHAGCTPVRPVLDFQFPITAFELPQPGAFGQFQRRLVTGVCGAVIFHPAADRRLVDPRFAGYLSDRPIRLDYDLRNLVTNLRLIFRLYPCQFSSSFPDRTLFGPPSGERAARHSLAPMRCRMAACTGDSQSCLRASPTVRSMSTAGERAVGQRPDYRCQQPGVFERQVISSK